MPEILGRVVGLRLAAQDHLVEEDLVLRLGRRGQDPVEQGGAQRPLLGQLDAHRGQDLAERPHLLQGGLVVDAVDQGLARLLQRLRGGDVRQDHELLDQPVRVEALRHDHPVDRALGLRRTLRSGRSRSSGPRRVAGRPQGRVGGPERPERRLQQRPGRVVRPPVDGGLRLRVGELGARSASSPGGSRGGASRRRGDDHPHRQRRRGPRPRAASTGRSRSARAASARPGRGSRPSCPAPAPPGRALEPGRT